MAQAQHQRRRPWLSRFFSWDVAPLLPRCVAVVAASLLWAVGSAQAETYRYDEAGRLTQVVYDDGSALRYEYDADGNVLQAVVSEGEEGGGPPPEGGTSGGGAVGYGVILVLLGLCVLGWWQGRQGRVSGIGLLLLIAGLSMPAGSEACEFSTGSQSFTLIVFEGGQGTLRVHCAAGDEATVSFPSDTNVQITPGERTGVNETDVSFTAKHVGPSTGTFKFLGLYSGNSGSGALFLTVKVKPQPGPGPTPTPSPTPTPPPSPTPTPSPTPGPGPTPGPTPSPGPTPAPMPPFDGVSWGNLPSAADTADPVSTATGELYRVEAPDLVLRGPMDLAFRRYYASFLARDGVDHGALGPNWLHGYEWVLYREGGTVTVVGARGRIIRFVREGGRWRRTNLPEIPYQLVSAGGGFRLADPYSQLRYVFNGSGLLTAIEDGRGNRLQLAHGNNGRLERVEDGLGRRLVFGYGGGGRLVSVGDGQRTVRFGYHPDGTLATVTDTRGGVTRYAYAGGPVVGLLQAVERPEGNIPLRQEYDAEGRVSVQTDALGHGTRLSYAPRETTITDALGRVRVHRYDAERRLAEAESEDATVVGLGYDGAGHRDRITDRLGAETGYQWSEAAGRPQVVEHADGSRTVYTYTARSTADGFVFQDLTAVRRRDASVVRFAYDAAGNVVEVTDASGARWRLSYNGHGQPETLSLPTGGVYRFGYDARFHRVAVTDPAGATTEYRYDALDRPVERVLPDGAVRRWAWDAADRLVAVTDERGARTELEYDGNGRLVRLSDALGGVWRLDYDALDRLVGLTDPLGGRLRLDYDALGRVAGMTDATGRRSAYGYDIRGRLRRITDPAGGEARIDYDLESIVNALTDALGQRTELASDLMGRITQMTSPLGHSLGLERDAMGRIVTVTDPLGRQSRLGYDARGLLTALAVGGLEARYARDALGNLTGVTTPNGASLGYTYDAHGRPVSHADALGRTERYRYDARGRVVEITRPDGSRVVLDYDAVGNLVARHYLPPPSEAATPAEAPVLELGYDYDALGRLVAARQGGAVLLELGYDAAGRLIQSNGIGIERDAAGRISALVLAPERRVEYGYDARGLVDRVRDWTGAETRLEYDAAGRLVAVRRPNGIDGRYTYDADGRLIEIGEGGHAHIRLTRAADGRVTGAERQVPQPASARGLATLNHQYDAADQRLDAQYDALGRLLDDGTRRYHWDAAGRLVGQGEQGYDYDPLGLLTGRSDAQGARGYVWNYATAVPSLAIEREGGGDRAYYVTLPTGMLLYRIDAHSGARWDYHYDERGNVLFVSDAQGAVIGRYAYTPYGRLVAGQGPSDNPFSWQGRYQLLAAGGDLYAVRARWYDAASQRFLSPDPVRSVHPRRVNPYAYALNDPVQWVDVTGASPWLVRELIHEAGGAPAVGQALVRSLLRLQVSALLGGIDPFFAPLDTFLPWSMALASQRNMRSAGEAASRRPVFTVGLDHLIEVRPVPRVDSIIPELDTAGTNERFVYINGVKHRREVVLFGAFRDPEFVAGGLEGPFKVLPSGHLGGCQRVDDGGARTGEPTPRNRAEGLAMTFALWASGEQRRRSFLGRESGLLPSEDDPGALAEIPFGEHNFGEDAGNTSKPPDRGREAVEKWTPSCWTPWSF